MSRISISARCSAAGRSRIEFVIQECRRRAADAPGRVRRSCKCTLGEVTGDAIPPGGIDPRRARVVGQSRITARSAKRRPSSRTIRCSPRSSLSIEGEVRRGDRRPAARLRVRQGRRRRSEVGRSVRHGACCRTSSTVSDPELSDPATREKFDVKIEPVERERSAEPKREGRRARSRVTAKPGFADRPIRPMAVARDQSGGRREAGDSGYWPRGRRHQRARRRLERRAGRAGDRQRQEQRRASRQKVNVVVRGAGCGRREVRGRNPVDPPELNVTIGEPKKLNDDAGARAG